MREVIIPTQNDIERVLLKPSQIENRARDLAGEIASDYAKRGVDRIVTVAIMKGALPFQELIIRELYLADPNLEIFQDYVICGRYGYDREAGSSNALTFKVDVDIDLRDRQVLVIEDIVER